MITFRTDNYDFWVRFWGGLLNLKAVIPLKFLLRLLKFDYTLKFVIRSEPDS